MPQQLCLVCGAHRNDVDAMHYFPRNLGRSQIWQEMMGMKYVSGVSLRNYLICNRHFTSESYVNLVTRKLRSDAVPSLFPCLTQDSNRSMVLESDAVTGSEGNVGDSQLMEEATPSTSGMQERPCTAIPSTSGMQRRPSTPKTSSRSVFRSIKGLSRVDSTPRKLQLMRIIESKESHVRKLKKLCRKRGDNIKALTDLSESSVVKNLFKDMPSRTANFLISQLRCAKRSPKGRRWTVDEKVVALALLKKSPKCYNLLRKIVSLPSKKTVLELLQQVPFHSGINEHLFKHIGECITDSTDKHCVLLFDEMDIKENLQYDQHRDCITGFEELGNEYTSKKWANRALVFMLQGLNTKWKQPVAYYFCNGSCPSQVLKNCIFNVIEASENIAGVNIVATVCDMGTTNVKTLKEMGVSVEEPYFLFNDKKIFAIFDPPHLLKCTVSLFRKHNVLVPVQVSDETQMMEARFRDIVEAHNIDKNSPLVFRAMYKIRDAHLAPVMQYAMKVNLAAQVMSRTVAAFLYTLLSRGELEQRSLATATFIRQVDELFDSFNGNRAAPPEGKDLKCFVTEESRHMSYWSEAFKMVKKWQFQRRTKAGNVKKSKPPSQVGWLITLTAIRGLWTLLHNVNDFKSLKPRSLNQDSLENLFGAIRGGCGQSHNPTPIQFAASLKTQILNGLTRQTVIGSNCEEDDHDLLTNLHMFLRVTEQQQTVSSAMPTESHYTAADSIAETVIRAVQQGATETLSVAYVSGFIAKRLLEEIKCEHCHTLLFSSSDEPHNLYIAYKEWSEEKEHLKYPSEALVVAVGHCVTVLEGTLDTLCPQSGLSNLISARMLEAVSFASLSCSKHQSAICNSIIKAVCRIGIPWWCKRRNQERLQSSKDAKAAKRKCRTFKHV